MSPQPGPHSLNQVRYIMGADGSGTTKPDSPTFYQELGQFTHQSLISEFSFDQPWPTWEMHPNGDEFVYLLAGDTDMVLWQAGVERVVRINTPGEYVVVPKGAWHTARPHSATSMLFVTPGEGTLNAEVPPDWTAPDR
ncbi:cupin domain-containing protein [Halieaceae bacterium IMCC14734]|uniref:Cupin domain-containing protein n=1 Tax=Candidatus Litorirhabdus singularis TaxID=2518993 RepID=A0ABT3TDF0_9GAMM|nr:cupin domain-containing protein [Candidatus Litorirhabdus singularis]MCX2980335.1 cupin domain-containing protein [Candidatus Litorirhabdus singularis]